MKMRLRMLLAFILVVFTAVASVVLFVRLSIDTQVRNFIYRGGMYGSEGLVAALEDYYNQNGGWQGIENSSLMMRGGASMMGNGTHMRMGEGYILSAADRTILVDAAGTARTSALTEAETDHQAVNLKGAGGEIIGYLFFPGRPGFSSSDAQPLLQNLSNAALRGGLIAGLLALALAMWMAARLTRPIQQLTRAAKLLAAGDLTQKVTVNGSDELAMLGTTFNQMTDSLHRSETSRQAMTADIAHELRTPLSVQFAHLEALQDGVYPLSVENLQPIMDQTRLLSRLVEDLRTLALADAGELKLEMVPLDVARLLDQATERFAPTARLKQVTIRRVTRGGNCQEVRGDADRFGQLINNLLSNALRYSPTGGEVRVEMDCSETGMEIRIRDQGEGIPAEVLPHIFERFYRGDQARSRDDGGTGLGLAIARQLAKAQGGDLTADNLPEGGAIIILTLPYAKPGSL